MEAVFKHHKVTQESLVCAALVLYVLVYVGTVVSVYGYSHLVLIVGLNKLSVFFKPNSMKQHVLKQLYILYYRCILCTYIDTRS